MTELCQYFTIDNKKSYVINNLCNKNFESWWS